MSLEIYISAKVDSLPQAHAVLAALHAAGMQSSFKVSPATVTLTATDNVPEEVKRQAYNARLDAYLDRELGKPAESHDRSQPNNPPSNENEGQEPTISAQRATEKGSVPTSEVTTALPNDTPPHAPVTRLYESVRIRITQALAAGKQPHKDDLGQAALMWHKGVIKYSVDGGYRLG